MTTVKCHGKVTSETAWELREAVKPLLALGGRVIVNLSDMNYLDSSGLGTLVGLKLTAMCSAIGDTWRSRSLYIMPESRGDKK